MGRNLQNCYTDAHSAIAAAARLEEKTGKPYFVKTDSLGYYYPAIDRLRLNQIRLIQSLEKAKALRRRKEAHA